MKKVTNAYSLDPRVIKAAKVEAERLSEKEDRKVTASEVVNKILKKALIK